MEKRRLVWFRVYFGAGSIRLLPNVICILSLHFNRTDTRVRGTQCGAEVHNLSPVFRAFRAKSATTATAAGDRTPGTNPFVALLSNFVVLRTFRLPLVYFHATLVSSHMYSQVSNSTQIPSGKCLHFTTKYYTEDIYYILSFRICNCKW